MKLNYDQSVWKLSKDGSIVNKTVKTPFGELEICTVDNFGGLVVEKEGTALEPNKDLLDRVEDNIRERFDLEDPKAEEAEGEY